MNQLYLNMWAVRSIEEYLSLWSIADGMLFTFIIAINSLVSPVLTNAFAGRIGQWWSRNEFLGHSFFLIEGQSMSLFVRLVYLVTCFTAFRCDIFTFELLMLGIFMYIELTDQWLLRSRVYSSCKNKSVKKNNSFLWLSFCIQRQHICISNRKQIVGNIKHACRNSFQRVGLLYNLSNCFSVQQSSHNVCIIQWF